jgi:hypothetical protein
MKTKTENLLTVMHILAWVVFIGLAIQAGAIIISYIVSIGHAQAAKNLFRGMDLYAYRVQSFGHYSFVVGYRVIFCITEAYTAYLMTSLLSKLNISKPFNVDVVKLMQRISYCILYVWLIAMVYNTHVGILEQHYGLVATYIPGDFIFIAAVVYVFAQMFKRGIEIQSENELTV